MMAARKPAAKKAPADLPPDPQGAPPPPLGTQSPQALAMNPANALFAAAAQQAGGNAHGRMPAPGPNAQTGAAQFSSQIPRAQPQRVEIRIDGRVRFANMVYEPTFEIGETQISLVADLEPTWVEPPKLRAPTRYLEQEDERNGTEIIHRVHNGSRQIVETEEDQ